MQEYMAHHQGMILVALDNYLSAPTPGQDGPMIQRFHADPRLQSVDLMLQERVPADVPLAYPQPGDLAPTRRSLPPVITLPWSVPATGAAAPHVHYLSNGRYSLLITASGGGVSRWGDVDLTRWRASATLDDWGTWLYVQTATAARSGRRRTSPPVCRPRPAMSASMRTRPSSGAHRSSRSISRWRLPLPRSRRRDQAPHPAQPSRRKAAAGADQLRQGCHGCTACRSTPSSLQ